MKIKALVPIFFSILVGFLFGRVIFDNYSKKLNYAKGIKYEDTIKAIKQIMDLLQQELVIQ